MGWRDLRTLLWTFYCRWRDALKCCPIKANFLVLLSTSSLETAKKVANKKKICSTTFTIKILTFRDEINAPKLEVFSK